MPRMGLVIAAGAVVAAVALTGCSPSGPAFTPPSHTPTLSPATTHATTQHGSALRTPAEFSSAVRAGIASLHSAHVDMRTTLGKTHAHVTGEETLADGTPRSADLLYRVAGAGAIRVVLAAGELYAKLPARYNTSGKPWVRIGTSSSNGVIAGLLTALSYQQSAASLTTFAGYAAATSKIARVGRQRVGRIPTTHYTATVSVAKLPSSAAGKQALADSGVHSFRVQFWLDGRARPVQVSDALTVAHQHTAVRVRLSRLNRPVTVHAPKPGEVGSA